MVFLEYLQMAKQKLRRESAALHPVWGWKIYRRALRLSHEGWKTIDNAGYFQRTQTLFLIVPAGTINFHFGHSG